MTCVILSLVSNQNIFDIQFFLDLSQVSYAPMRCFTRNPNMVLDFIFDLALVKETIKH